MATHMIIFQQFSQSLSLIFVFFIIQASALHVSGQWDTNTSFFTFVAKFGFQMTLIQRKADTQGYIFGNITAPSVNRTLPYGFTLAVLDKEYFYEYYKNRNVDDKDLACKLMFEQVQKAAYNVYCNEEGKQDFLRRIPCPQGRLCLEEDSPELVVNGYQFTFAIQDLTRPRFWYASLVACYQDVADCTWHHSREQMVLDYDIWLVNGDPSKKGQNPFEYQFSYDLQDTVEIYLLFLVLYLLLLPLLVHAMFQQRHTIRRLMTAGAFLELISILCNVTHVLLIVENGEGLKTMSVIGDVLDILGRSSLMLLLMLLAKGWAITRQPLSWPGCLFVVLILHASANVCLYVWMQTEVDVIEDIDEYQTWPGWLALILRFLIMLWFLYELRSTIDFEHDPAKVKFFLHFAAAALIWFLYLPIVAVIAPFISALWRFKFILSTTYSADFVAFAVLCHLLWPTRSHQYFLLAAPHRGEELEEFAQAPHLLTGDMHTTVIPPAFEGKFVNGDTRNHVNASI